MAYSPQNTRKRIVMGATTEDGDYPIETGVDYVVVAVRDKPRIAGAVKLLNRDLGIEAGDVIRFSIVESKSSYDEETAIVVEKVGTVEDDLIACISPVTLCDDLDLITCALLFTLYGENTLGLYCTGNISQHKACQAGVPVNDVLF